MENKILNERYKILNKVGVGGMATVYRGKDLSLNRTIAIKILKDELQEKSESLNRFEIEAQSIAALSHLNIVSIYDIGKEDDINYFIMEFVDGESLKEKIDQNVILTCDESIDLMLKICKGVEHAHNNNIIHRDLKPHNILITKDGTPKIADFGIAKFAAKKTMTKVGSVMGSAGYISPEQARGKKADNRSDIYSLGITLYEMLTGQVPFVGETAIAVIIKHIQEMPKAPYELNSQISQDLSDLIMKMITKNPEDRYQNIQDLVVDLESLKDLSDSKPTIILTSKELKKEADKTKIISNIKNINAKENKNTKTKEKTKTKENLNKKDNINIIKDKKEKNIIRKKELLKYFKNKKISIVLIILVLLSTTIIGYMFNNIEENDAKNTINTNIAKNSKEIDNTENENKNTDKEEPKLNQDENIEKENAEKNHEDNEDNNNNDKEDNDEKTNTKINYDNKYFKQFFINYYNALSNSILKNNFSIVSPYYEENSPHYIEQKNNVEEYLKNYKKLDCLNCSILNIKKMDELEYKVGISVKFQLTKINDSTEISDEKYYYTAKIIDTECKLSIMETYK